MAKVGEGDARWIVADRADGTNCNAWHWEEKDLTSSTHEALKALFKGYQLSTDPALKVTIKEIADISGDVTVAQRKGKIMCYFDLKLTMKWSSSVEGETEKGEGKITIAEIDHDGFKDAFEIAVSAADSKKTSTKAEAWIRANGREIIRTEIRNHFDALYVQHNVGKMLKNGAGGSSPAPAAAKPVVVATSKPAAAPVSSANTKASLTWKLEWRCPVEELWSVMTDNVRASHYTRAPAKIDPRPSGIFEYLGGLITGYFVEVLPYEKLAMQWRLSSWPSGQFSTVIMQFKREEAGVSRLEFAQAGIVEGDFERVRDGWLRNFWDPIKAVFGFHYDVIE